MRNKLSTLCRLPLLGAAVLLGLSSLRAQYNVEFLSEPYDTLIDYRSAVAENFVDGVLQDVEVPVNMQVPYCNSFVTDFRVDAFGSMYSASTDHEMSLYSADYFIDLVSPGTDFANGYFPSDLRYNEVTENGVNILQVEYHNIKNIFEFSDDPSSAQNHSINFTIRIDSRGVVEIHFGDINLDSATYFIPGIGWVEDPGDPNGFVVGPLLALECATGTGLYIRNDASGNYFATSSAPSFFPALQYAPSSGDLIRFIPDSISNLEGYMLQRSRPTIRYDDEHIWFDNIDAQMVESIALYNVLGELVSSTRSLKLDRLFVEGGIYTAVITQKNSSYAYRVWLP